MILFFLLSLNWLYDVIKLSGTINTFSARDHHMMNFSKLAQFTKTTKSVYLKTDRDLISQPIFKIGLTN